MTYSFREREQKKGSDKEKCVGGPELHQQTYIYIETEG